MRSLYLWQDLKNYTLTYRGNPGRAYLTVDKKQGNFVRVAVWDVSERIRRVR